MASIKFRRLDEVPMEVEIVVLEIAEHFSIKRPYFQAFCELVRTSKRWNMTNLQTKLSNWVNNFSRFGDPEISEIVVRAFNLSRSNLMIRKLRGLIVEALLIGGHGGIDRLNDPIRYGWGAEVQIITVAGQQNTVSYECASPKEATCLEMTKYTVDIGCWDGTQGLFFECKAHPDTIKCIDVEFLRKLNQDLQTHQVEHKIFFVCLDTRKEIEIRLIQHRAPLFFKAFGTDDLEAMIPA